MKTEEKKEGQTKSKKVPLKADKKLRPSEFLSQVCEESFHENLVNERKANTRAKWVEEEREKGRSIQEIAMEYMTVKQVCVYLKISRTSLWSYTKHGLIKPRRIGGRILYARADIDDYLNGKEATDDKH